MCTDIFYNSTCRVCEKVVHYNRYPARHNPCSRLIGGWACLGADVQVQTVTAINECGSCTREAHQEEQEYMDVLEKFVSGGFGDDDLVRNLGVKFLGHLKDHVDPLDEEWEKNMMELEKKLLTLNPHSETSGREMDATSGARHGIPLSQTHRARGPGADEAMFRNRAAESFLKKERAMRLDDKGQRPDSAPPAADYQEPSVPYRLCKRNSRWQSERDSLPWCPPSDEGLSEEERILQQPGEAARETASQSHRVERQEVINRLTIDAVQHNMEETSGGPAKGQDEFMSAVLVDPAEPISDLDLSETGDSGDEGEGTPLPDSPTVPDNVAFRAVVPTPSSSNSGDCTADTTRSALSANQDAPTRPAILAVPEAMSEPDLSKTDIDVVVDDLGELENE